MLKIWTDESSDFRKILVSENPVVRHSDAFQGYKALENLISGGFQTLSELWTHRKSDANQLSEIQTSLDFIHLCIIKIGRGQFLKTGFFAQI